VRLVQAGILAALTAVGLAALRPPVFTSEERAAAETVRANRIRADIRFLASDLLGGRGPSTPGDELAQAYIASRFEAIGLEPASGGTWRQPFDLVAIDSSCPKAVSFTHGTERETLRFGDDFIASSGVQEDVARIADAEVVFVGYGIVAPEYDWDDFKGADLRGKVLLVMNNDPESDPDLFAGRRRLYYGRWDYKFDQAARVGAAGAIIIHTTPSAGYGWSVVQSSWTGTRYALPAGNEPAVQVKAWATDEASRRLVRLGGQDLDILRAAAQRRDFRPVPLGVRLSLTIPNRIERRRSANVIGRLPGGDTRLSAEAVLYTAHHDHLGSRPAADGQPPVVYNGALDNASGVAQMLAVAEAFAALSERPRRSILFAAVGAEEQGLLGSQYLASHLPVPAGRVAADINIDGINIWGRTSDVAVVGLGKSTLDEWIRAIAEAQGRTVTAEAFPDRGSFYRSDHLSFARVGIPSAYLDTGTRFLGRPEDWGRKQQEEWEREHYHQPSDDLTPGWDFSGAIEDARLLFYLGAKVANTPEPPQWRPGDEFEAVRRQSLDALGR
jgi:Zn-dependent M28 family amino/carboxypeptidase